MGCHGRRRNLTPRRRWEGRVRPPTSYVAEQRGPEPRLAVITDRGRWDLRRGDANPVDVRQLPEPIGIEVRIATALPDRRRAPIKQGVARLVGIVTSRVGDAIHPRRMIMESGGPSMGADVGWAAMDDLGRRPEDGEAGPVEVDQHQFARDFERHPRLSGQQARIEQPAPRRAQERLGERAARALRRV